MLLSAVMDIDPDDQTMKDLGELAYTFGLFDMTEVLVVGTEAIQNRGKQVMFIIDEERVRHVVRLLLACSILNYAGAKHEKFEIEVPSSTEERWAQKMFRTMSVEEHTQAAKRYLQMALDLIKKYPSEASNQPAA